MHAFFKWIPAAVKLKRRRRDRTIVGHDCARAASRAAQTKANVANGTRTHSTERERRMEAVLKNLSSTVELLAAAARSGDVIHWDAHTLSRAFHWACYCEHLFSRYHHNPKIREVMEVQLQRTNSTLRAVYGEYADLSFLDLSQCQHLLLKGLLNNPKLPLAIMKILFDTKAPEHGKPGDYPDVTGLGSHIIQCKSAGQILNLLSDQSAVGADAEVQASMLMENLHAMLGCGVHTCWAQRFLDSLLQGCKEAEHLCLVLSAALLTGGNTHAQTTSVDFLLDWIQQKHSLLRHICFKLPLSLVKDLAKRHVKFRDAYCAVLKEQAGGMEYCINAGEWVQRSANPKVSFQEVTEHFVTLLKACPSWRSTVEKELNELKISAGDFDVRGLSVWGDLLEEIHKVQSDADG
ncbi:Fanconi anemia group F protein isoform X1 [Nerophis lumbriciformis]|uniref:Fanconi anemia group F protein isoform X1 n=1 Tax=Nerophis lumbriciformis TaxID=546530 RepID=UPI002AE0761B|nr:Fanconi anemia group F protein-like isoform X1 [Nerophis lumbriciformis]